MATFYALDEKVVDDRFRAFGYSVSQFINDEDMEGNQDEQDKKVLEAMTQTVVETLNDIKRGDIVCIGEADYRNDGKFIWDGKTVQELHFDIDDYGSVPPEYAYPEFPLEYWDDSIDHNFIRWVSEADVEKLSDEYDVEEWGDGFEGDWGTEYQVIVKETGEYLLVKLW